MFILTFVNYGVLHANRSVWSAATKEFLKNSNNNDIIAAAAATAHYYGGGGDDDDTTTTGNSGMVVILEADVAGLNTTFLAVYSLGVLFTGQLADRYRHRLRHFILVLYSLVTIVMLALAGLLTYVPRELQRQALPAYYAVKAINGLLQSPCWAIHIVLLNNWFPKTGRGLLLGVWGCNTHVGNILGAQAFKWFSSASTLGAPFLCVASMVFGSGLLSFWLLVESPADVGILLSTDDDDNDGQGDESEKVLVQPSSVNEESDTQKMNFWQSFAVPGVVEFSICFFLAKIVKGAMYYWVILYLETPPAAVNGNEIGGLGYDSSTAINIFSWYETGALLGSMCLGLLSDLLPVRSPVYVFATLSSALLVVLLGHHHGSQQKQFFGLTTNLFALGAVLGGKSLLVAAMECDLANWIRRTRHLEVLGTIAGIIDGVASFGAIASQSIVLAAKSKWGWTGAFHLMGALLAVSLIPATRFLCVELSWSLETQNKGRQLTNSSR